MTSDSSEPKWLADLLQKQMVPSVVNGQSNRAHFQTARASRPSLVQNKTITTTAEHKISNEHTPFPTDHDCDYDLRLLLRELP